MDVDSLLSEMEDAIGSKESSTRPIQVGNTLQVVSMANFSAV